MIGGIKGYCILKSLDNVIIGYNKNLDPKGYKEIEEDLMNVPFLRVVDVAVDKSGLLVLAPKGNAICDVRDMNSVKVWVEMEVFNGVVLPPGLTTEQKVIESTKRLTRKGGYNKIIRQMVVAASLHKGEFNDDFLFYKC